MSRLRPVCGLVVMLALMGGVLAAQEKRDPQARGKGQLPPNWNKLGLSDEQKEQVYKIQAEFQAKIEDLEAQLRKLRAMQGNELRKVLTDAQRQRLLELATQKTLGDKELDKKP